MLTLVLIEASQVLLIHHVAACSYLSIVGTKVALARLAGRVVRPHGPSHHTTKDEGERKRGHDGCLREGRREIKGAQCEMRGSVVALLLSLSWALLTFVLT